MFNFLKNLFRPKKTDEPHPLDGPVRAANEKAALPQPTTWQPQRENTLTVTEPAQATVTVWTEPQPVATVNTQPVVEVTKPSPPKPQPLGVTEGWPFPTSTPKEPPPAQEKKPRKPRVAKGNSKAVARNSKKK